ncbi:MAG: universal stress protein [Stigonema ocellatum SAG 48.90 = DSM 106950]|nr:universal stress protein [Stigonema ocellatum SAG 48.90 = DSM 106950]
MFHKILVAMDCSETGKYVFDEALSLAKAFKAHLMLLHVLTIEEEGILYTPVMLSSQAGYPMVANSQMQKLYQERRETLIAQGIELLRTRTDEATAAGVTTEFTQILGNPSRTICDFAYNWGADLIVVGRRGLSGFNEFLLGSVSNYVLHHAKCSVLTVQHSVEPASSTATAM